MGRRRIDSWLPPHLVALRDEVTAAKREVSDRRKSGREERLLQSLVAYRAALEAELSTRTRQGENA